MKYVYSGNSGKKLYVNQTVIFKVHVYVACIQVERGYLKVSKVNVYVKYYFMG